jgi:acylphosphatase
MAAAAVPKAAQKATTAFCYFAFEIYGKVQGVFFRKHTEQTAKMLRLHGWCENTSEGTVRGEAHGDTPSMRKFREWLSRTGSPKSRIDKAEFRDELEQGTPFTKFDSFAVRK